MPTKTTVQRIAITPGEPAGIGPDITIMLAQESQTCELIAIADPDLLEQRARQLNLPLEIIEFEPALAPHIDLPGHLKVLPLASAARVKPGQLDTQNVRYVLNTISRATRGCLDQTFDAMVTGPVHKGIINDAGFQFSGHTEYVANITGGHPVMMLTTPSLRVALATTHLPLIEVSNSLTQRRLRTVIKVLHKDLIRLFGIEQPNILVCGLNPHAGEGGHLGHEEIDIIEPVLIGLRNDGINAQGPLPADTLFTPKYLESADAVLAMYHDQGLPVLKHMGFGQAVNITLGLPIIRTSVDHGTALDLAATGNAEVGSLKAAIQAAQSMVNFNWQHR
jgi:4-hydroxythreonine-4-phosphate dehydrogenase